MGQPDPNPMKWIKKWWTILKQDKLLGRIIKNTSYLFSSNSISIGLSMVQSILAGRLLGVESFGVLGTITVFASTINRLFSFRMGELIVKYLGDYLPKNKKNESAALVKAAALTEAASSLLAFLILLLLSPLAARYIAKDMDTQKFFMFYGITILGNLLAETSTGILQITNRFNQQAVINLSQSILTAGIILFAYLTRGSFTLVLLAYLTGKMILGLGPVLLAWRGLKTIFEPGWIKTSFEYLPPMRELSRFAISTNLSATVNLLVRDSELLWVAFFLSPLEAGYYKTALAVISFITIPITPFISTTYPEISHSVGQHLWKQVRRVLRRVTLVAGVITSAAAVVIILFGKYLILFYGEEYLPAYPVLLVLLIGYGASNLVFWNRPLLLSLNKPMVPFKTTLFCGLAKLVLAFPVIPAFGKIGAAALLSAYFILSGGLMAREGVHNLRKLESAGETL